MIGPPRGFSLRTATFVVVSSMIGGGVLTTSGYVALDVGSHALMIGLWVLGGLIAACGALTMAEISASVPRSGGEVAILDEAYGPLVGFLGGWVSLLFGFVGPIAATSSAAAAYGFGPWGGVVANRTAASLAILGFAAAHATGRTGTERVQGLVTAATIAVLSAFVVAGVVFGSSEGLALLDAPPIRAWPGPTCSRG